MLVKLEILYIQLLSQMSFKCSYFKISVDVSEEKFWTLLIIKFQNLGQMLLLLLHLDQEQLKEG